MGEFFALCSYCRSVKELSHNLLSFFHLQGPKGYPGPAGLPGEQVSGWTSQVDVGLHIDIFRFQSLSEYKLYLASVFAKSSIIVVVINHTIGSY